MALSARPPPQRPNLLGKALIKSNTEKLFKSPAANPPVIFARLPIGTVLRGCHRAFPFAHPAGQAGVTGRLPRLVEPAPDHYTHADTGYLFHKIS
jgi:hypothetical protein